MSLYFNSQELPHPSGEYVAWLDGMGTGRALGTSLAQAANFVMKLHVALATVNRPQSIAVYPLMDGAYITSPGRNELQDFLRHVFQELAEEFLAHSGVQRRFLARCGIAFGTTIHGNRVGEAAFGSPKNKYLTTDALDRLNETLPSLLLSSAMVAAFRAEACAAPFGAHVDDSALSLPQVVNSRDTGFPNRIWRWWGSDKAATTTAAAVALQVREYLAEAKTRIQELDYPLERINAHERLAEEYFRDLHQ